MMMAAGLMMCKYTINSYFEWRTLVELEEIGLKTFIRPINAIME
jgi:hypothetical protein